RAALQHPAARARHGHHGRAGPLLSFARPRRAHRRSGPGPAGRSVREPDPGALRPGHRAPRLKRGYEVPRPPVIERAVLVGHAELQYMLPRLTGLWKHLERQAGGIGTRGPGETQLEVDRRRVRERIAVLLRHLAGVERDRETQRARRRRFFRAALVGYTNAGK